MAELKQVISIFNPTIMVWDNFMGEPECKQLIKDINDNVQWTRGRVTTGDEGNDELHHARTNQMGWLDYQKSPTACHFLLKASQLTQLHYTQAEQIQALHYELGEEYDAHLDAFPIDTDKGKAGAGIPGNRVATLLLYLNDVADGGATVFTTLGKGIQPKTGRCVLFSNTVIGTQIPDEKTRHQAQPVLAGEKYALNLWFRNVPLEDQIRDKMVSKNSKAYK
jgi:prolyl 4-hydroxylase|tara:strand:- start:1569 stop:2234 length:666 start_codon:yes stop_codon:yes gene_type:complete